jgi:hypothetical protein
VTIGAAWIRRSGNGEELWIASDSRLSGDEHIWDVCPKLMPLPRRDAVAGFSGSTTQAYPLLLQLSNAIGSYRSAADGTMDFFQLVKHLEHVANALMSRIEPDPQIIGVMDTRTEFSTAGDTVVLGGYSRIEGRMGLYSLRYFTAARRWQFQIIKPRAAFGQSRLIAIFGDKRSKSRYGFLLKALLKERGVEEVPISFDFEPFEVLAAMLQMPISTANRLPFDRRPQTIGGAPQLVRVLPGAQATAIAVMWNHAGNSTVHLQGRPTFEYENLDVPLVTIEESDLTIYGPSHWPEDVIRNRQDSQSPDKGDDLDTFIRIESG